LIEDRSLPTVFESSIKIDFSSTHKGAHTGVLSIRQLIQAASEEAATAAASAAFWVLE